MDPFLEQLKALCTAHPTRAKWVFVPTHAIGRTLGDRLALAGTNWANLRFVTPLEIALRMGAPFLVERGIDPSEEALGPALMMRLLLDLPLEGGYFRPLADHPTLAQALWRTVRELRMSRVHPHQVTQEAFESEVKHRELVALLAAYERFLDAHKRADMAAVYEEALAHRDWCPIQSQDCWTELPDANWNALQRALLDTVAGERLVPHALRLPDVSVPRRLAVQHAERHDPELSSNALAFLMSPPDAKAAAKPPSGIHLFHAGGREAEIEEVFRRILASGVSLDQVEIACASDAHAALVWEKALRHEWPIALGIGIPASATRPGRALLGLCDWVETDFSAAHLRLLLQSGDIRVDEVRGFTAGQAARVLARALAGWGRATYRLALDRLRKGYDARAEDVELSDSERADAREKADRAARVQDWLGSVVASIPVPNDRGEVPLQSVVLAARAFLAGSTARSSALDHRAAAALDGYIGELDSLGTFSCTLTQALRFVRERVQSLTVAPERPRPGHLFASQLSQLGYSGRPHLFVVGLEEGRVFAGAAEDAILLDAERAAISNELRLSTDRIDEAVYAVLSRLAVTAGTATFSYSSRDTREFRETYASWLMLQAFRLQQRNPALSYPDMHKALGEPKSIVPAPREAALSPAGWWVRSLAGTADDGTALAAAAFPHAGRGSVAEAMRESSDFTAFDGCVPEAGPLLDPAAQPNVYSVTELERAAECPFRFFLKRGLGIRPPDDRERDRDTWLDPLTRGSELHAVYAALLRRTRAEQRRPDETDRSWLIALAQQCLTLLHEEMPAPTSEILERETRDFLADVELFLDAELTGSAPEAVGLEVSFGRPLDQDEDPLARAEPVTISLGGGATMQIAGRIDRIDQVAPGTFEVLDYKTGGYWKNKWTGVFAGGQRLQHALYAMAASELLKARHDKPKVRAGVYYFSSHKGRLERVRIPASPDAAVNVLNDLRELIVSGQFTRTPDQGHCTFCDYATACGRATNEQAANKVEDPRFPAFHRLAAHE